MQFVFEPHIEFGLNAAQGTVVAIDEQGQPKRQGTFTRTSFGGFVNVSNGSERYPLLFGVGGLFTRDVDQNNIANANVVDNYWLWQSFAAVQYMVFQQLYIKLVGSYSRAPLAAGQHESCDDVRRRKVQRPSSIFLLLLAATRRARENRCAKQAP